MLYAATWLCLLGASAHAVAQSLSNATVTTSTVSAGSSSSVSVHIPDASDVEHSKLRMLGPDPLYPFHPSTSIHCTWWYDNNGDLSCDDMLSWWLITVEEWHRWNSILAESCEDNFVVGRSYFVAAFGHPAPVTTTTTTTTLPSSTSTRVTTTTTTVPPPPPTTTTTTPTTTTTTSTRTTPTTTGNGIQTPQPPQPGMVGNCDAFHVVSSGDTCTSITIRYGITLSQFTTWNPQIGGSACTGIWLDNWVCVSIIGHSPPTTTTTTTTTRPGNGINTPQPTQSGMVGNCDRFHYVELDQTCAWIAAQYGITQQQFLTWNPSVGQTCSGLWAYNHVCVRTIGFQPPTTTTTTTRGNGISTPVPWQPAMVSNCDRFHLVRSGETCAIIGARNGVTSSRIATWNGLTASCGGLWAETYACVRTIGFTPAVATTCTNDGLVWGDNRPAARNNVVSWCNGDSSTDGVGNYAIAQTKYGCYNAPFGANRIAFTARNDFGAPATMSTALCNEIMRLPIDRCNRGGTGTHEGWFFRSVVLAGRC